MAKYHDVDDSTKEGSSNVFNMGLERMKAIRNNMNGYAECRLIDQPLRAFSHIDLIYSEIYCDLSKDEAKECEEELNEIAKLIITYRNEKMTIESNKKKGSKFNPTQYNKSKGELMLRLRNFYIKKIVVYMNNHNILKPDADDPKYAAYG